ncbi:26S proteasome regulatory subunit rpn2, partial [Neolecta irregularis DAH-3]
QSTSPYSEGGSLYALGLIYANHGSGVLETLREQFRATQDEVIQHGAALGLGVAGMATGNDEIYEDLKGILYGDNVVSGEATGLAMGLIMLGTANEKALDEMLQYAKETQHEKIIRGLAMGIALLMYGKEEAADTLIDQLCGEADPILRYGGIFTIALAYAGTGNNKAIRRLLHVAVSDANDDVRRVAVMALGFLLFRNPTVVPRIVQLLSVSYNPHVRYGAALALGIACAGTGLSEAIELLEPMTKDATDFVRQGAYISMAMILIEQNELYNLKVATARKHFEKVIGEKHEEAVAKFGAALAQGIIDAGGRNVQIGLSSSQGGNLNLSAIVGMAIFTQYWYWFPLTHFLSLAFTPTSIIGLNKDLKAPQFKYVSNSRPWMFAYPAATTPPSKDKVEAVPTAVLSTTARAKARAKKHEKEKVGDAMDTDAKTPINTTENADDKMETDEPHLPIPETSAVELRKLRNNIATSEIMENMRRVLPMQLSKISFYENGRYQPVKKPTGGVVMVHDNKPDDPEELIELKSHKDTAVAAPAVNTEEDEAKAPEPFEYPDSE